MLRPFTDEYLRTGITSKLFEYLSSNSNLPGPRGNLELAASFANSLSKYHDAEISQLWNLCRRMTAVSTKEAPVNSSGEFIPFCGTVGIGSIAATNPEYFPKALLRLKELANDPRWRMREAVAMGLQRLMAAESMTVLLELKKWIDGASLLELRAVVAAVAEPAILKNKEVARTALKLNREVVKKLIEIKDRKSEEFRVLRKALGYTLSVVIVPLPEEGFEYLEKLIKMNDSDVTWIVKQNLKKNRLVKRFPEEVNSLKKQLN